MKKTYLLVSAFLLLLPLVSAQQYNCPMGGYGGMMYGYYGSGALIFGWIIGLLLIALLIAAIYWLIKSADKRK